MRKKYGDVNKGHMSFICTIYSCIFVEVEQIEIENTKILSNFNIYIGRNTTAPVNVLGNTNSNKKWGYVFMNELYYPYMGLKKMECQA